MLSVRTGPSTIEIVNTGRRATLNAITPRRLADEVADRLRRYIIDNQLTEGARLPAERTLAETLGTSRATVSQALRILAVTGLIEVRHGSGAYISRDAGAMFGLSFDLMFDMEPGSLTELADFRYWIERALLAPEAEPRFDAGRIDAAYDELVASDGVIERFVEADARFHAAVVAATRNRYLTTVYERAHRKILSVSYAEWIQRGRTPGWLQGPELDTQLDLHRDIEDAVITGNVSDLTGALERHQDALLDHLVLAVEQSD
jgi:GntR family transcriptional repressor for pyruvate dehydrogenase complex